VIWAPGHDPWAQSGTLAHQVDGFLLGNFTTEGALQSLISGVTCSVVRSRVGSSTTFPTAVGCCA
jgi:hypothetical protein